MATTTKRQPAKRRAATPARSRRKSSLDYVQDALQDIERARERAGDELRENLDAATERLSEVVGDLRKRAEDQVAEWEDALEQATEDARRELGRRAVMAQQTPGALDELLDAIRARKAELVGPPDDGAAA